MCYRYHLGLFENRLPPIFMLHEFHQQFWQFPDISWLFDGINWGVLPVFCRKKTTNTPKQGPSRWRCSSSSKVTCFRWSPHQGRLGLWFRWGKLEFHKPFGYIYIIVYILYYIILYCIILYYIILYYLVLYYIVLYYIILYYIILYCIILYYISYYIILFYIL
jgi:hypothetical protein